MTHYEVTEAPGEQIVRMPIGRALSNTQLYIVDREMQLVPAGVSGELCVGSAPLAAAISTTRSARPTSSFGSV